MLTFSPGFGAEKKVKMNESLLGASLAGQKKYAEAEPLLLSGYQGMTQRIGTIPAASRFRLEQAGKQIIALY